MEATLYVAIIWVTAIVIGSLSLVIYLGSTRLAARVFSFTIFSVAVWTSVLGLFAAAQYYELADFSLRTGLFLGSVISASFLYFFYMFPGDERPPRKLFWLLAGYEAIILYLCFLTDFITTGPVRSLLYSPSGLWEWNFGGLYFVFELPFFGFFVIGLAILARKYLKATTHLEKKNLIYMITSLSVGLAPATIFGIILPQFGYFTYNWIAPASGIFWVPIMSYSIIRYHQMNVRLVVTEVLVVTMAVIFFINIFISESLGVLSRVGIFVAFLIPAYFLIRGLLREAKQREELNDLNLHLNQKVAEQTEEIRRSLEAEKKARVELEKLNDAKDQFIMITQHHLRTPLTSVLWGLESSLKGEYGPVGTELKGILSDMHESGERLMKIVDDFLNITALKVGRNILNVAPKSLKPAMDSILEELKGEIHTKNIAVKFPADDAAWPLVAVDYDKMRESLFIMVDNAVKYNRPGGSVDISTRMDGAMFELRIQNTGIGIVADDAAKIGTNLFYRSEDARKNDPIGMGIGLSVAKAIIKAHNGTFSIESGGKDQGALVAVRLPLK
ncbi:MAG: hypothetical protein JWO00_7 [Candidatus Parcubacteria bacterium]|nr:hypothetical protein [Candidatus Parcubacteria bacterium]